MAPTSLNVCGRSVSEGPPHACAQRYRQQPFERVGGDVVASKANPDAVVADTGFKEDGQGPCGPQSHPHGGTDGESGIAVARFQWRIKKQSLHENSPRPSGAGQGGQFDPRCARSAGDGELPANTAEQTGDRHRIGSEPGRAVTAHTVQVPR